MKTPDYYYCDIRADETELMSVYDRYNKRCPRLDFDVFGDDGYMIVIGEHEHLLLFAKMTDNRYPILKGYYK